MSENMQLWNKLHKPPTTALKPIAAGRLKGKSDINPQWRMQAITEACGPCGFGWKYTIDRQWTEQGEDKEVCAFTNVSLYVKLNGEWSEAIPGTGGSMLIAKEKNGMFNSDEAFKMSTTDALSVAFKALGMAAEIYLGNFDGSKYLDRTQQQRGQQQQGQGQQQQGQQGQPQGQGQQQKTTTKEPATQDQLAKIADLIQALKERDGGTDAEILKTISHFVQNEKEYFLTPETLAKNCSKGWAGKIIGKAEGMLK